MWLYFGSSWSVTAPTDSRYSFPIGVYWHKSVNCIVVLEIYAMEKYRSPIFRSSHSWYQLTVNNGDCIAVWWRQTSRDLFRKYSPCNVGFGSADQGQRQCWSLGLGKILWLGNMKQHIAELSFYNYDVYLQQIKLHNSGMWLFYPKFGELGNECCANGESINQSIIYGWEKDRWSWEKRLIKTGWI